MEPDWTETGRWIERRIAELHLSYQEVVTASGPPNDRVSDTSLRDYRRGAPIVHTAKRRQLARALRCTPESFEAVARGERPTLLDDAGSTPPEGAALALEERVGALEQRVAEMGQVVGKIEGDVASVLREVRPPRRRAR